MSVLNKLMRVSAICCLFLPISIFSILVPAVAPGNTSEISYTDDLCGNVWGEYVSAVKVNIGAIRGNKNIVFLDRKGNAFDCLDLGLDESFIKSVELIEKSLPFDRESMLGERPEMWPPNICSVGETQWANVQYISVSLPVEKATLALEACRKGVDSGLSLIIKSGN